MNSAAKRRTDAKRRIRFMGKIECPSPASFPPQKPMELPGRNTVYEPEQPGIEIPGQPLKTPEPAPDLPLIKDPPVSPVKMYQTFRDNS